MKYISEHKSDLPEEVEIDVKFLDVETEAAWNQIYSEGKYDYVIAYYISSVLHDREHFFERVSEVLSDNGVFSFNGAYVNDWHYWVKEVFEELGLESNFVETLIAQEVTRRDELNATLNKYFGKVESVLLPNSWHYKKIWNPKC